MPGGDMNSIRVGMSKLGSDFFDLKPKELRADPIKNDPLQPEKNDKAEKPSAVRILSYREVLDRLSLAHLRDKVNAAINSDIFKAISNGSLKETQELAITYYVIHSDPSCPPVSRAEFTKVSGLSYSNKVTQKSFSNCYNRLARKKLLDHQKCVVRPTIYVKRFWDVLHFNDDEKKIAYDLCAEVVKRGLCGGRSPVIISAAIIYLSREGRMSQREVADTLGVTEPSMRSAIHNITRVLPQYSLA